MQKQKTTKTKKEMKTKLKTKENRSNRRTQQHEINWKN